jgi:hypothetical protein
MAPGLCIAVLIAAFCDVLLDHRSYGRLGRLAAFLS